MEKKEIIVLGGGISGLSLLWYLRKYLPHQSILLLEKAESVGGVIKQVTQGDIVFDQGPKTFRISQGRSILELIQEVHLQDKLIFSSEEANKKYLYFNHKLHQVPSSFSSMLSSSLTYKALPGLLKEMMVKKVGNTDETIGAFMRRRFGNYVADTFVEPFVTGICGGDMHKLSIQAYFPKLKQWEEEQGSVLKGLMSRKGMKKPAEKRLFNLRGGLATLTETLGHLLKDHIRLDHDVQEINKAGQQLEVRTNHGVFLTDQLFVALPLASLKRIKLPFQEKLGFFYDFPVSSLVSVSFAYKENVLPHQGFGYLVPSKAKEKILGVLFDKSTFPTLDSSPHKTKLTVMMGGMMHPEMIDASDEKLLEIASDALLRQLDIFETPDAYVISRYPEAIPQYPLYHRQRVHQIQTYLAQTTPHFKLAGSYLSQASVAGCVEYSKALAQEYAGC